LPRVPCVAFRTDASAVLGVGHLKRCLALAAALRELGAQVVFVARDLGSPALNLVEAEGHVLRRLLRFSAKTVAEDAIQTAWALADSGVTHIVIDHYGFDAVWHKTLRAAWCPNTLVFAAIDDLADRDLEVDLLIDHNLADDHRHKYGEHLSSAARLLGGPRFALLGPAYAGARRARIGHPVESIGIFLGGTDPGRLSMMALRACRSVAGFAGPIEIVTTTSNPAHAELAAAVADAPGTKLSIDLPDLSDFFARHGLQVGAGGGASWERCCIGAPSLLLETADNQRAVIPQLAAYGAIAALPVGARPSELVMGKAVAALLADQATRQRLAGRSRTLVDGHGAMRAALALLSDRLTVRRVGVADAQMMFDWRNHPKTRAVSRQPDVLTPEGHAQWLERTLADPTRLLLVGEIGAHAVGVIRFDRLATGRAEVSLYLDPSLHGLGLGPRLLAAGEQSARHWAGTGRLDVEAIVLTGNAASQRLFRQADYRQCSPGLWRKEVALEAATSNETSE
jgi:UDP-2,4-diacetamido-2,4,6-trideoxy-beta-L-altropyranose hydrolase